MTTHNRKSTELLRLAHDLGDPQASLALLAEGNVSTRLGSGTFLVKASGTNLHTLRRPELVACRAAGLLALLDQRRVADAEVQAALMDCRVDRQTPKPSVEALFHAWLLTLPGVEFVGHTHPVSATGVLCSRRARQFAVRRLFPDEIVCCDVESVFVPYTDPGLRLAQAIRKQTEAFLRRHQRPPRVVLLGNHGVITIGATSAAVLAAMLMVEKAARIWLGAASLGGPVFLNPAHVARIAGRADEKLRRRVMKL